MATVVWSFMFATSSDGRTSVKIGASSLKALINDFEERKALNTKLKAELKEIQSFKGKLERQKIKIHEIKKQLVLKKEEKEKPVEKIKQRVLSRGFGR